MGYDIRQANMWGMETLRYHLLPALVGVAMALAIVVGTMAAITLTRPECGVWQGRPPCARGD